jgi:hypothetical protein
MGMKQSMVQLLLNAVLLGMYVTYVHPMLASRLNAFTNIAMFLGFFLFTFGFSMVLTDGSRRYGYPLAAGGVVLIAVLWLFIIPPGI